MIKFISHRGNINKIEAEKENTISYIMEALKLGYDVEFDVRCHKNRLYFGHDEISDVVPFKLFYLYFDRLWVHCKDDESIRHVYKNIINKQLINKCNIFRHENESYAHTSNGDIWIYPGIEAIEDSILVLPDTVGITTNTLELSDYDFVGGICSDNVELYRNDYYRKLEHNILMGI